MQAHKESVLADSADWIGCLTYQSRAVARPAPGELEQLVANAEAAVHELKRRGVSGLRLSESLSLSVNTEIILHSGLRNDCSQQVADFA